MTADGQLWLHVQEATGYADDTHRWFHICGGCASLVELGRPESDGPPQPCSCDRVQRSGSWHGFDFHERARLCECCRGHVLLSGSRWSVWFCPECKPRVVAFNSALRTPVLPIGRHSMMEGSSLRPSYDRSRGAIEEFVQASLTLFDRIEVLRRWSSDHDTRVLETLGFAGIDVHLSTYFLALASASQYHRELQPTAAYVDLARHAARVNGIDEQAAEAAIDAGFNEAIVLEP